MIRVLAFVLLTGCMTPAVAWSQPAPSRWPDAMSRDDLRGELDRLARQVRSTTAADAPSVASTIPSRWRVDVGDRERLEISTRWLIVTLDQAPANGASWPEMREALGHRLEHMREEIGPAAGGEAETRVRARTSVRAILSRSEFDQGAASRWREDLRDRITRWIEAFFARLGISGQTGERTVRIVAWIIGIGALAGLGAWLARTLTRQPRHLLTLGTQTLPRARAHDLAVRALAYARAGDVREAVRIAYHASVVRLEEQGVWRLDDARTPREYVRMLAAGDNRRAPLLDMTRRFEQILVRQSRRRRR